MYSLFALITAFIALNPQPVRVVREFLLDIDAPPGYFAAPFVVEPRYGHIWVRGSVVGKPIDLVIDSGASNCAVSERTAELLKLKVRPNGVVKGLVLAGSRRQMGTLPPLVVGGLTTAGFDVDVYDFQPFIKETIYERSELHGMIGSNLLTAYGAIIDYSKRV